MFQGGEHMNARAIEEIARRQLSDYDARRPGSIFENREFTLSIEDAFDVQREVARLRAARGEAIAGYKIGCVSEAVQRQLGIGQPIFGYLFATELYRTGVSLDPNRFCRLAVEGELAVRIGGTCAIGSVFPVIELHNHVVRGGTAQELIVNNALHAGVVLPAQEILCSGDIPPGSSALAVFRQGQLLGSASGAEIAGGPLTSVVRVARHMARWAINLEPGQIVLTGSPLPLYPVEPGDHILVRGAESIEVELFVNDTAAA
jgi:2-keto-4-pentenoate hydratase